MKALPLVIDPSQLADEIRRRRTGWSFGISTVCHILAFLLLTAARPVEHHQDDLVEVTLLDTSGSAASVAAAPASAPSSGAASSGAVTPSTQDTRFQRQTVHADLEPTPQSDYSIADQITARLSAMRESSTPISAGSQLGASPSLLSSPAGVPGGTGTGPSVSLSRGGGTGTSGISLGRGGTGTSALGTIAGAPTTAAVRAASAPDEEKAARRVAGANLMGPIADRRVIHQVNPVFPEWAKRDGVEGSVTLYFVVRANGDVAENVLIQKTSGFGDFDENARAALREWRFEPLRGGQTGDQWGTITLNFRLRNS